MAGQLECTITTPEQLVFDGAARGIVVPAVDGEMGFLPRHAPLVGTLGFGELRVDDPTSGGKKRFFVNGGFVQVVDGRVTVLAVEALPVEKLDAAAEREALAAVKASPPPAGTSLEERDEHLRQVQIARTRVRLAGAR